MSPNCSPTNANNCSVSSICIATSRQTHSEVVPVLGNKGAGKTHLLHSIKHGGEDSWQLLVTPGTYQRDTEFLEYLLFQFIDTLLGGGKQKNVRPLEYVGEQMMRVQLAAALKALPAAQRLELFPAPGLGWARRFGFGGTQAQERTQWLIDSCRGRHISRSRPAASAAPVRKRTLDLSAPAALVCDHIERTEPRSTGGLMRRHILQGFGALVFHERRGRPRRLPDLRLRGTRFPGAAVAARPRIDLVQVGRWKCCATLRIPVVIAFDQLEDLLLARRSDDAHRTAEAFFAGIVHAMHHIDGVSFLIFAERGLWNRFVPSLDGYIQDRLNNPIHLPKHGTLKTLRLEAPSPELVRCIVEARLRPALEELPDFGNLSPIYPFSLEQIERVARTEPTLRDMLQQFRKMFDLAVFDSQAAGRHCRASNSE